MEYFLLQLYQRITACPIEIHRKENRIYGKLKKIYRLWALLVTVSLCSYGLGFFLIRSYLVNLTSSLSIWNEATNFFGVMLTCVSVFIETQLTHKRYLKFLYLKQKTDDQLQILCRRKLFEDEKYNFIHKYWHTFLIFLVVSCVLEIFIIIRVHHDKLWMLFWSCLMVPLMFTRLRCLQHPFYTGTLHLYVRLIRLQIDGNIEEIEYHQAMCRKLKQKEFILNSEKIFNDLCLAKRIYSSIHEMSLHINKMFAISLLINLIENFVQLLSNLFWIYSKLHHQDLDNLLGWY